MKPEIDVCRLQMHQEVYLIRTKNQVVGCQNISVVGRQAKAVKEEDCTKPSCLQNFVPSSNHILFFFWVKIFENGLMSLLIYRQLYFLGIERGIWVLSLSHMQPIITAQWMGSHIAFASILFPICIYCVNSCVFQQVKQ